MELYEKCVLDAALRHSFFSAAKLNVSSRSTVAARCKFISIALLRFKPAGLLRQWNAGFKLPVSGNTGRDDAMADLNSTLFNDDFEKCTYEQNAQFAEQQKARWCEEYLRWEEFEKLLSELGADAQREATRHGASIDAALQENRATFTQREAIRCEQFTKAQSKRADAFAKSQEQRQIDSEWYMAFRLESLKDGRQGRKKLCEDIKQTFQKQHENLLDEQEALFKQNEERRNSTVERLIQGLGDDIPNPRAEATFNQSPTTDTIIDAPAPPETTEQNIEVNHCSDSNSIANDPAPLNNPETVQNFPPCPVNPGPSNEPSPVRNPSSSNNPFPIIHPISSNDSFPNVDPGSPDTRIPIAIYPASPSQHLPSIRRTPSSELQADENKLDDAPTQPDQQEISTSTQMQLFRAAERKREAEFRFSEEERNMEEGKRSAKFQAFESSIQTQFDDLLTGLQNVYSRVDRIRDLSEQARIRESEDEVEMMESSFDEFLERCKGKANGLQVLEEQLHNAMVDDIRALLRQHLKDYKEARKLRDKRFADAQALREIRLGVFIPRTPKGEPQVHGPLPTQDYPSHASSPVQLPFPWEEVEPAQGVEYELQASEYTEDEPDGSPTGRRRPHFGFHNRCGFSPGAGFAPQALLMNEDIRDLPVPDHHSEAGSMPEIFGPDAGQHKKFLYRKSKAQRASIFATSSLRQNNIFVAAEVKRAHEFQKAQAGRKAKWLETKQAQYIEVTDNISILNEDFVAAEEQRTKEFGTNEKSRVAKFKEGQLKKEETHHNVQEDLTRKCLEAEAKRLQALRTVRDDLFFDMKESQTLAFEDEESKRERLHLTSISLPKDKADYR